jgi:hypothetical protein
MKTGVDQARLDAHTKEHTEINAPIQTCEDMPAVASLQHSPPGTVSPDGVVVIGPSEIPPCFSPSLSLESFAMGGSTTTPSIVSALIELLPSGRQNLNSTLQSGSSIPSGSAHRTNEQSHSDIALPSRELATQQWNGIVRRSTSARDQRGPGDPWVREHDSPPSNPISYDPRRSFIRWAQCGGMLWYLCLTARTSGSPMWIIQLVHTRRVVLKCGEKKPSIDETETYYEAFPLFPAAGGKIAVMYPDAATAFGVEENGRPTAGRIARDVVDWDKARKGTINGKVTPGGCDSWHEKPRPGTCGFWFTFGSLWTMDSLPDFFENNDQWPKGSEWEVPGSVGLTFPGDWHGWPSPVMFREAGARWKCCGEPSMYAYAAIDIVDSASGQQTENFAFGDTAGLNLPEVNDAKYGVTGSINEDPGSKALDEILK